MKKLDNFINNIDVLQNADFKLAFADDIYRTGVAGQFNLTFELACKALQAVLRLHGVSEAENGSPREILQAGYKYGFLDDPDVWINMMKKRNKSIHIYNEDEIDDLVLLIQNTFIPEFSALKEILTKKVKETGEDEE